MGGHDAREDYCLKLTWPSSHSPLPCPSHEPFPLTWLQLPTGNEPPEHGFGERGSVPQVMTTRGAYRQTWKVLEEQIVVEKRGTENKKLG